MPTAVQSDVELQATPYKVADCGGLRRCSVHDVPPSEVVKAAVSLLPAEKGSTSPTATQSEVEAQETPRRLSYTAGLSGTVSLVHVEPKSVESTMRARPLLPTPVATQSDVEEHEMASRVSSVRVLVVAVHVVPPSVVDSDSDTPPSVEPMTTHSSDDRHDSATGLFMLKSVVGSGVDVQPVPPSVETRKSPVAVPGPTASQSEAEKHTTEATALTPAIV
jgi:hypothetical protein